MGETENYIGGLEHETFHAFQGTISASRLAEAENANRSESQYPWDNPVLEDARKSEQSLLVSAVRAQSDADAAQYVRQFLAQRDARRTAAKLDPKLVDYERQREWLEGLAKYVELSIGRTAGATPGYVPVSELKADSAFKNYTTREQFWSEQIDEAGRTSLREGETRFYYSGMVQAMLLDRLLPGWKARALNRAVMLEDLLREAISHSQ